MKNIVNGIVIFIFFVMTPHYLFSQSAVGMANCSIKHSQCLSEAEKQNDMLKKTDPFYEFFKCMNYAHCSCEYWLCRCTGEGEGNFYSSEPGTVASCLIGCKTYFSSCNDKIPQKKLKRIGSLKISGRWNTSFGTLILNRKGNFVYGTYTHDKGRLVGILIGNELHGKWMEAPSYKAPKDAGDLLFIFSSNGKSFSGKWRYGFGGEKWNGSWSGTFSDY